VIPQYLSEQELLAYKNLIGPDEWCIKFDKVSFPKFQQCGLIPFAELGDKKLHYL
jgi:hypothetical protein